jgi:hypothetical protein
LNKEIEDGKSGNRDRRVGESPDFIAEEKKLTFVGIQTVIFFIFVFCFLFLFLIQMAI